MYFFIYISSYRWKDGPKRWRGKHCVWCATRMKKVPEVGWIQPEEFRCVMCTHFFIILSVFHSNKKTVDAKQAYTYYGRRLGFESNELDPCSESTLEELKERLCADREEVSTSVHHGMVHGVHVYVRLQTTHRYTTVKHLAATSILRSNIYSYVNTTIKHI